MTLVTPASRLPWLGIAAGVFGVVGFSTLLVVGRLGATSQTLTLYDLAGLRHSVSILCALPILIRIWPWRLSLKQHLILSVFGGAPFLIILFAGMAVAPVAHAAIVVNGTLPLMAAIVAWLWLRQLPGRWQVVGMVVAGGGVLLVGWEVLAFGVPGQWRGHLLFLAAAGSIAVWYSAIRLWDLTVAETIAGHLVLNAVVYVPIWLFFLPSGITTAPPQDILLQAVILGVWGAFIATYGHAYAARTLGPTRQAAIMSGGPALAALLAVPVLGETPSALAIAGIAVVATGILMTVGAGLRSEAR